MIQGAPENVCRRRSADLEYELVLAEGHGLNGMKEHNTRYAPKQHMVEPDLEAPSTNIYSQTLPTKERRALLSYRFDLFVSHLSYRDLYQEPERLPDYGVKVIFQRFTASMLLDGAQNQL